MKTLNTKLKNTTTRYIIIALTFIFLIQVSYAQKKLKEYIFPCSAMLLSGMLNGTNESISFHYYNGFKRFFPSANDQYWNPAISWTNKYKNGNPNSGPKFLGSTSALVCFTDAYHGLRTGQNIINTFTISLYFNRIRCSPVKVTLKRILIDALLLSAVRNIGFYTTYSFIFNQGSKGPLL
ncbi:MAG TPA: hypothetical protein VNY36_04045 [Bacteroidia bacterium]|jgi:hypothetical protein|nr:hypothetical protein [Bacteroidia bacterium]